MFPVFNDRLTSSLAFVLGLLLFVQPLLANDEPTRLSSEAIKGLIQDLGADSYATRLRAREKLEGLGLDALDELQKAQSDLDYEIALAASYLAKSLAIIWSRETDPPQVREALHEYNGQNDAERESRIKMLAELPDRIGLSALVRIARFDDLRMSRKAAIAIMEQAIERAASSRGKSSKIIRDGLAGVDRQSADWLRVYALDLAAGDYSTEQWQQQIQKQRDQLDSVSSAETNRLSVLSLVRVCAVHAAALGKTDEALRLATENADLVSPTTSDLIEASNWAIDNGLHPFVIALQAVNQPMFDNSAVLLYGYANALRVGGDETESQRIADLAYQQNPLPRTKEAREKMQPKELEDNAAAHRDIAVTLRDRGLFKWAERESRQIIDSLEFDDMASIVARSDLSRMFEDLQKHQDVVEVLKPLVERMEKDATFKQKMMSPTLSRFASSWQARIDYHTALITLEENRDIADRAQKEESLEKARKKMLAAFLANQDNIDVLIRMYRTDGDDEWRALIGRLLDQAKRTSEARIQNMESLLKRARNADTTASLAELLNNYAWLICNTEGDLSLALKRSLRSLEFVEDSAKLDTCARCYFAVNDLDNAIRTQKRALALDPYSPPLKRQLAEFEAAKTKAQKQD